MLLLASGMLAGILYRPLLVPWLLASGLFLFNYAASLLFLKGMTRLGTGAAAGLAVVSFLLRFVLLGASLVAVALVWPDRLVMTAVSFLVIYTLFFALETAVNLRSSKGDSTAQGGEA